MLKIHIPTKAEIKEQIRYQEFLRQHPELEAVPLPTDLDKDFEGCVSECRSLLVSTAADIVGWDSAEDIVQHTIEKVYKNIKLGRSSMLRKRLGSPVAQGTKEKEGQGEIENPTAYLLKAVRNCACNYLKSKQKSMDLQIKISQLREG